MEDLKKLTKRVFNNSPQTPPQTSTRKQVVGVATGGLHASEHKDANPVTSKRTVDSDNSSGSSEDDDHLRDDIEDKNASFNESFNKNSSNGA